MTAHAVFVLDPATATGQLYSAGHGPIFFYSALSQTVTSLDSDDMPLGVTSDFGGVQSRTLSFQPDDMLILITDGFFEWPNAASELFGTERIEESIRRHAAKSPADLIEALHRDVLAYAQSTPQQDDLTAVIIPGKPIRPPHPHPAARPRRLLSGDP